MEDHHNARINLRHLPAMHQFVRINLRHLAAMSQFVRINRRHLAAIGQFAHRGYLYFFSVLRFKLTSNFLGKFSACLAHASETLFHNCLKSIWDINPFSKRIKMSRKTCEFCVRHYSNNNRTRDMWVCVNFCKARNLLKKSSHLAKWYKNRHCWNKCKEETTGMELFY